jgi:chromosome partitioning protein
VRTIAVVNQKGGVGKTTTSVNLGAALALRGRRVLLVDMDPQGNLTDHLLGDPAEGTERASVYEVLVEGKPAADAVVPTSTPGLFVLPSHEDMAGAELDLAAIIGREVLLRDALAGLPPDAFDYVLLDCPPSLGLLSLNALAAASEVFIALQTEFFAMRGLSALDRTIDLVRRRINPDLVLGGIVATLVDPTRLSREVVDEVRGHYGDAMFAARIRTNIRLAEAPSHGKHIFDYAPESAGAADYAALAKEMEEGRPAAAAPATAGSGDAVPAAPPPSARRGIARAIAEATAAVSPTPPGARSFSAESLPPPTSKAESMPTPPDARSFLAGSTPPPPPPPQPPPLPPAPPPRRATVSLPVLRAGTRGISLPPRPTRPPSALPPSRSASA